ncbi:MAG: hypothetical protein WCR01_10550 [Bacteroidota bacterium]
MKSFNVIYQHGHFIDKETGKNLNPQQGFEFVIIAEPNSLLEFDDKLTVAEAKSSEDKKKWAINQFGEGNYIKIGDAGDQLRFRIGNSKFAKGDETNQYILLCSLNEDLYIHLIRGRMGNKPNDWRLAECICKLEKCLEGNLRLSEVIKAESLNKLFSHTVQFFFSTQRSGSTNVFTTFYFYKEIMKPTITTPFKGIYESLDDRRFKAVRSFLKTNHL